MAILNEDTTQRIMVVMARNYGHARFAHVSDFSDNGGPMPYVYQ